MGKRNDVVWPSEEESLLSSQSANFITPELFVVFSVCTKRFRLGLCQNFLRRFMSPMPSKDAAAEKKWGTNNMAFFTQGASGLALLSPSCPVLPPDFCSSPVLWLATLVPHFKVSILSGFGTLASVPFETQLPRRFH